MKAAIVAAVIAAVLGGLGLATVDPPSDLVEGGLPAVEPAAQMPDEIVAEPVAEGEQEPVAESEPDAAWDGGWESYGYEPEWVEPEPYIASGEAPDLKTMGRVYADGAEWTWYSEQALPGGGLDELNSSSRTVNDGGYVTDGEGYIAIASPDESVSVGTEVDTPWGPGRVYDYNPGDSWDVYTSWE